MRICADPEPKHCAELFVMMRFKIRNCSGLWPVGSVSEPDLDISSYKNF